MAVTDPTKINYLYRFDCGGDLKRFSNVAEVQTYNAEDYIYTQIEHTPPTLLDSCS